MPKTYFNEEDDNETYIPEINDDDSVFDIHNRNLRSNAGMSLGWSLLEQQMFDLLLLNRHANNEKNPIENMVRVVSKLIKNFSASEVARIMSVAMLAIQFEVTEKKSFNEEFNKYKEYTKKHPEDLEEF